MNENESVRMTKIKLVFVRTVKLAPKKKQGKM